MDIFVLSRSPQCDFCHSQEPVWRWKVRSFAVPLIYWKSDGNWAACDACNDLILASKWFTLLEKTLMTTPNYTHLSQGDQTVLKIMVGRLHKMFRQNLLAPLPERIKA